MATMRAIGTIGELWQGPYQAADGSLHIGIVTLPCSDYYTEVTVDFGEVDQQPPPKSYHAIKKIISHFSLGINPSDLQWSRNSNIPPSIGMASSTADVVATIDAVAALFGMDLSNEQRMDLLKGIERSDPIFSNLPGLYLSKAQCFVHTWEWTPSFEVKYAILPGKTNTENSEEQALLDFYQENLREYQTSFQKLHQGFSTKSIKLLSEGSTSCAALFQKYCHIPLVDALITATNDHESISVIRAYTGHIAGVLYDPTNVHMEAALTQIDRVFSEFNATPITNRVGYGNI